MRPLFSIVYLSINVIDGDKMCWRTATWMNTKTGREEATVEAMDAFGKGAAALLCKECEVPKEKLHIAFQTHGGIPGSADAAAMMDTRNPVQVRLLLISVGGLKWLDTIPH
jgi:hypothetical protein